MVTIYLHQNVLKMYCTALYAEEAFPLMERIQVQIFHHWQKHRPMRRDDDGLSRLSGATDGVPQQPPGHGVHPGGRLVQEDDRRPTNQSHSGAQLSLVPAAVHKKVKRKIMSSGFKKRKPGIFFCFFHSHSPVAAHQLVGVRLQQQRAQDVLHAAGHVLLRDSPEPGVHAQRLSARHVVQHGVELRAVADALLYLRREWNTELVNL